MKADVVLLGCGKAKLDRAAPARELYTGNLFRASLRFAELRAGGGPVYIVSAEHGLVELDQVVEPYEAKLANAAEGEAWGEKVFDELRRRHPRQGYMVILAGDLYARPLRKLAEKAWWNVEEPLRGLAIGGRLKLLKSWNAQPEAVAAIHG